MSTTSSSFCPSIYNISHISTVVIEETSKLNLQRENIPSENILVTGNTVIDALLESLKKVESNESGQIKSLKSEINGKDLILVTGHRRENHGDGFIRICNALKEIAEKNSRLIIIYPVHLNPNVEEPANRILSRVPNIKLISPLAYADFIWLMKNSKIILTDSGGVQEEAPSLGKPVLVMRDTTERPEAVDAGTVILVGTNKELIVNKVLDLIKNKDMYKKMSELHNPYGDGNACQRIINFISNK